MPAFRCRIPGGGRSGSSLVEKALHGSNRRSILKLNGFTAALAFHGSLKSQGFPMHDKLMPAFGAVGVDPDIIKFSSHGQDIA